MASLGPPKPPKSGLMLPRLAVGSAGGRDVLFITGPGIADQKLFWCATYFGVGAIVEREIFGDRCAVLEIIPMRPQPDFSFRFSPKLSFQIFIPEHHFQSFLSELSFQGFVPELSFEIFVSAFYFQIFASELPFLS